MKLTFVEMCVELCYGFCVEYRMLICLVFELLWVWDAVYVDGSITTRRGQHSKTTIVSTLQQ